MNSDLNEERRRTEPKKRVGWAKVLIHPGTLKALIAVGQLIAVMLRLVLEVIHTFKD